MLENACSSKVLYSKCIFEWITGLKVGCSDHKVYPRSERSSARKTERVENGREMKDRDLE
jgi:hypothetical protein